MPQMQPMQAPMQPLQAMPQASMPTAGGSMVAPKPVPAVPVEKKDHTTLIFIIIIVFLAILMVTFFGLFLWKMLDYNDISSDVNGRVEIAVAAAKDEQAVKDEQEFLEREKYPLRDFSGPADYGQLSFKYPKTWSLYVASDASNGGNFEAYFNPIQVDAISSNTINALRVSILTTNFESVTAQYEGHLNDSEGNFRMESITLTAGVPANLYSGKIPNSELNGYILVFKIRDKTVVMQTDSVNFLNDFNQVMDSIRFNA